jgi:hypothetical protein
MMHIQPGNSLASTYLVSFVAASVTPVSLPEGFTAGPTVPTVIPVDELFFWTADWQAGESAAEADLSEGRTRRFMSADDLIRDLLRPGSDD